MNLNHFEAIQTVQKLAYLVGKDDLVDVDVSIHPPFTDIRSVQTVIDTDQLGFALGAQHCHWEEKGAFTGEVVAGRSSPSSASTTSSPATASGASCSARPTRWSPRRSPRSRPTG